MQRERKMRENNGPQQKFVSVIFDFEYDAEEPAPEGAPAGSGPQPGSRPTGGGGGGGKHGGGKSGKKIVMRENEVLLLINKTNADWWQVIRRGDRRPFYAPAKYVSEIRPAEIEAMRRKYANNNNANGGSIVNDFNPSDSDSSVGRQQVKLRSNQRQNSNLGSNSTSNLNNNLQQHRQQQLQASMSTFSASNHNVAHHPQLLQLNNNQRKRNSFSPPSETVLPLQGLNSGPFQGQKAPRPTSNGHQHPPSTLTNQRFNERYRSNSLDSILVGEMKEGRASDSLSPTSTQIRAANQRTSNKHPHPNRYSSIEVPSSNPNPFPPGRRSDPMGQPEGSNPYPPHHPLYNMVLPPLSSKRSNTLEKRPTFESLDKRKSWSVADGALLGSSSVPSVAKGSASSKWSQKAKGAGSNPAAAKGPAELAKTSKGRISAYQNTEVLFPAKSRSENKNNIPSVKSGENNINSTNGTLDSQKGIDRRKPVPLPRSKIPTVNQTVQEEPALKIREIPKNSSKVGNPSSSGSSKPLSAKQQKLKSNKSKEKEEKKEKSEKAPAKTSLGARFFSRKSKTDLGSDSLAAYKAKKGPLNSQPLGLAGLDRKYPAPKVPTFNRPVPQKRTELQGVSAASTTVLLRPDRKGDGNTASQREKAHNAGLAAVGLKQGPVQPAAVTTKPAAAVATATATARARGIQRLDSDENSDFEESSRQREAAAARERQQRGVRNAASNAAINDEDAAVEARIKPEIKEKPQLFSTFKVGNNSSLRKKDAGESARRYPGGFGGVFDSSLARVASESDLIKRLEVENNNTSDESVTNYEAKVTTFHKANKNYYNKAPKLDNMPRGSYHLLYHTNERNGSDNHRPSNVGSFKNKLVIGVNSYGVDNSVESVSSGPGITLNMAENSVKSEPLQIRTEPLNDRSSGGILLNSGGEEVMSVEAGSCSTSFESSADDDSSMPLDRNSLDRIHNSAEIRHSPLVIDRGCESSSSLERNQGRNNGAISSTDESLESTLDDEPFPQYSLPRKDVTKSEVEQNQEIANATKNSKLLVQSCDSSGSSSVSSRTKSPAATSTTSRSPPSPGPLGISPIRQVLPDWNEYEDSFGSGRKFYYNTVTKEKSWKPPRKPKGASDAENSAPSSPTPESEANFKEGAQRRLIFDEEAEVDDDDGEPVEDETVVSAEPAKSMNGSFTLPAPPSGYELRHDGQTTPDPKGGERGSPGGAIPSSSYYVNIFTGVRWFAAEDEDSGKVYYYEENGNESCWSLPDVGQSIQDHHEHRESGDEVKQPQQEVTPAPRFKKPLTGSTKRIAAQLRANNSEEALNRLELSRQRSESKPEKQQPELKPRPPPLLKTKTEMLEQRKFSNAHLLNSKTLSAPNFTIGNVNIVVVKQGTLSKTKLIENGKRKSKNWSNSHVVLTDTFLLFFKDLKMFNSMMKEQKKSGSSSIRPETTLDLKAASVDWCTGDKSKRSHVFEVASILGLTILMRDDNLGIAAEWFQEIKEVIGRLNAVSTNQRPPHPQVHPVPGPVAPTRQPPPYHSHPSTNPAHGDSQGEPGARGESGRGVIIVETYDMSVISGEGMSPRKNSDASQVSQVSGVSNQHHQHQIVSAAAAALADTPGSASKRRNVKVSRTKSLKMKILGSNEELLEEANGGNLSAPIVHPGLEGGTLSTMLPGSTHSLQHQHSSNKVNIREKLRKFFQKRPTMDDLFKRGIIKNEPVFGSTLKELIFAEQSASFLEASHAASRHKQAAGATGTLTLSTSNPTVPLFVRKCISEIEKGDFLQTDGVYRQSGNLSHIQKIRLQVDQGNFSVLEGVDDVHVLTGSLKLFFRELKEPLILWDCVAKLLKASSLSSSKAKIKAIVEALKIMPSVHKATLQALLNHLTKVTELREFNRMQIPNLAIVFGPTLMWPPNEVGTTGSGPTAITQNLALDMMQQNIIVETLLNNADAIF